MKAVIINQYGSPDVLEVSEDHPKPSITDQEVLINIRACSINPIDWKMRAGDLKLIIPKRFPRILGADVSGVIVEIGNNVSDFKVGDEVYGMLDVYRGGGYSEYAPISAITLCQKPTNLSFEEAAAVPLSAQTALQSLRDKGKIKKGSHILINGASGGVGSFAVQIAKAYGADVTAVSSTSKKDFCLSLGADTFVDYTKEDLASINGKFDSIIDVSGKGSFFKLRHLLASSGTYVDIVPSLKGVLLTCLSKIMPGPSYHIIMAKSDKADLEELKTLIENGKVRPIIEEVLPLEQVAEGHRKLEQYHSTGKTVLQIPCA